MASTTDFKKLFERYQEEGAKRGISIAQYCQMNGIVYNQYERWYKQFRNIVATPVEIVNENVKEQTVNVPYSALPRKNALHTFASNQNKNYYGKRNDLFRCVRNVPAMQRRKRPQRILHGMRRGLQSFYAVAA